jgi:hypothetical protein
MLAGILQHQLTFLPGAPIEVSKQEVPRVVCFIRGQSGESDASDDE